MNELAKIFIFTVESKKKLKTIKNALAHLTEKQK
jgi:hypothetical protein